LSFLREIFSSVISLFAMIKNQTKILIKRNYIQIMYNVFQKKIKFYSFPNFPLATVYFAPTDRLTARVHLYRRLWLPSWTLVAFHTLKCTHLPVAHVLSSTLVYTVYYSNIIQHINWLMHQCSYYYSGKQTFKFYNRNIEQQLIIDCVIDCVTRTTVIQMSVISDDENEANCHTTWCRWNYNHGNE
jgi:hypothetical protein